MHIVFAYLRIGKIITDPTIIKEYSRHPHVDKSLLYNSIKALYIPRNRLLSDRKLPG